MHFALIPCLIFAAAGAAAGWIVRDRDYYKSKSEPGADAKGASSEAAA